MSVICILGPTAMGKTDVAMRLHALGGFDVISVDSAMVYRGLNIGTAKPDPQTLARCPHALIDICDPWHAYSVAQFIEDAHRCIRDSLAAGRTPILVGGTMLYFKRLFDGLAKLPEADAGVRAVIDEQAAELGWPAMHDALTDVDPQAASRIAPNDAQRIQRALEIYRIAGQSMTALQAAQATPAPWPMLRIALLSDDRATLHARISARFDQMLEEGFEAELAALLRLSGMHPQLPSMRAVGYRQMAAWLGGSCSREQAIKDAKTATRRLAKRQHTWLRSMSDLQIFDPLESTVIGPISSVVNRYLENNTST